MTGDSTLGTDRRIFIKRAVGTVLASGASACVYARVVLAGVNQKSSYPDRWVYVSRSFDTDRHVEEVAQIARTASEHGLTAMVLSGMDRISLGSPEYLERLRRVKAIADQYRLEIIPSGFNTGYGGAILDHNKNLAEGMLVKDALLIARDGEARFQVDSPLELQNSGFEQFQGDRFTGFDKQDEPGRKTFVDTTVFHSGNASLRIENFAVTSADEAGGAQKTPLSPYLDQAGEFIPKGIARVAQMIRVTPYRCYRVSAWVKTEDVDPASLFSIKAFTPDGRDLCPFEPPAPAPTSGWRRVTTAFNSWYADTIELNFGVFEGVKGKVWVDDVEIEEVGLMNVVRRKGAPLTVRDESTGAVYEEGRDFAQVTDPHLDFLWTHEMPSVHLLPGSRIQDGARLRLSYYHGTTIYNDQVSACPSEAETYEIWKQQFPLIEKYLNPKRYFLSVDEVRLFNRCEACRQRQIEASAILGQMTGWLYRQVRAVNSQAEVLVWSDMFDPNHNSTRQYYLVDGSMENTWQYLPKDMGMVLWYFDRRRASLDFFSSRGFRTIAAAYYDRDLLKDPEGWLEAMDSTPNATGIMYTTWKNKYQLLAAFGDLVSKHS
jgi:NADH:ubiquinone oxidoreductase subunit